ncbi:MAG: 1,4-dihydroxy-2-naphthoate octaprenyltransferase [Flavobacteriaceae bacterium]|nr:1,4-dihydroxy-2-naphthoate octaprenyltransferase [Flavobacteriaceae bacterium]
MSKKQTPKYKVWLTAARLRTLPLSVSGILVGTAVAISEKSFDGLIFILALLTTIAFQVLSNFANDYGDGVKGTDNEDRIGPKRALQSGALNRSELKKGILLTILISLLLAGCLIYVAFGVSHWPYALLFVLLGLGAVGAAIKYTVGQNAYGYRGLGDLFVFLFFGGLAVLGTYFLYTMKFSTALMLPAAAIGFLSTGVLHLNNMRDRLSDQKAGKNTLAVKLGEDTSKIYHAFLMLSPLFAMVLFAYLNHYSPVQFLFLLAFIPVLMHLKFVLSNKEPQKLDPELKKLALSTFLLAVLFLVAQFLRL